MLHADLSSQIDDFPIISEGTLAFLIGFRLHRHAQQLLRPAHTNIGKLATIVKQI